MGVVTGGDQQLPGGVDPNSGQGDQGRRDRADEGLELGIELGELGLELVPAPSQGPQPSAMAYICSGRSGDLAARARSCRSRGRWSIAEEQRAG
jgi:hypothetical protein